MPPGNSSESDRETEIELATRSAVEEISARESWETAVLIDAFLGAAWPTPETQRQ